DVAIPSADTIIVTRTHGEDGEFITDVPDRSRRGRRRGHQRLPPCRKGVRRRRSRRRRLGGERPARCASGGGGAPCRGAGAEAGRRRGHARLRWGEVRIGHP
ncbi:hypothetical protein, partial [Streptomyces sp. NPDC047968]|uniref:hypothetical protein n=1 Tax=Streptomyces sp. NPDC047968 TaxID=3155382 RepID=UPI003445AD6E